MYFAKSESPVLSDFEVSASVRERDLPSEEMTGGHVEPAAGRVAKPAFDGLNSTASADNDRSPTLNAGKPAEHTKKSPAE